MSNYLDTIPKRLTIDSVEIHAALEFVRRYYPTFWDRVDEEDLVRLLLLGYTLFKSNPEILEVTDNNKSPTQ